MLKTLKRGLLTATKQTRLLKYVASSEWRRQRLLILCYHSIALEEEHLWRRPLFFTVPEFEERLQLLHDWGVNVLPLGAALERLRAGTLPPRSVVLTFDDGTADFHQIVWPRLKRYRFPATVYATTFYGDRRQPVFSLMCSYLLWKARHRMMPPAPELGVKQAISLSDSTLRTFVWRAVIDHAQREGLNTDAKNRQAARLAEALGIDYNDLLRRRVLQLMTPDEIRHVAADGADVQLHTHRHRAPRRRDLFDQEIEDNRVRLESLTRLPTEHFCYPSGVNYPEFLPWLTAQQIKSATTCIPGLSTAESSLLLLPRVVDTAACAPVEFEGWLSGFSEFLPRRSGLGHV